MGAQGRDALLNGNLQAVELIKKEGNTVINHEPISESFSIHRQNGHWQLMGRVNYQREGNIKYRDFNLRIAPPDNLIFYDTLVLSWYKIRDRVPDAADAFTSPNKDIALVKTKNKLLIFKIEPGQLAEIPLAEIELAQETEIIMAEWAVGSYVESWESSFLNYGGKRYRGGE
jgi:hypothetical protein